MLLISMLYFALASPVYARHHHDKSNPGKDLADKATHNVISGIKDAIKHFVDGIAESNSMLKLVKNGLIDGDFKFNNYVNGWADTQLDDLSYSFNDRLNEFAVSHAERYADFLKLGEHSNNKPATYNYALMTDVAEDSAKRAEIQAKNHAGHIKTLSKAAGDTKDLKSAQDANNQINLEQAITLNELLKMNEISLRQQASQAKIDLEEHKRKIHFHDVGSKK